MRTFSSRRSTIGLSLLIVLTFSLTLSGVMRLTTHATAATATLTLSKVTGPPTTTVTINGAGFGSSETVTATLDTTTTLGTTTTSSTGTFSLGITIPATALPGSHTVQATGQNSGLTASRSFLVNTDWRQFGYDATHSGTNPYENVLSPTNVSQLTLDWFYSTGRSGNILFSPAVVEGVLYFGSGNQNSLLKNSFVELILLRTEASLVSLILSQSHPNNSFQRPTKAQRKTKGSERGWTSAENGVSIWATTM